MNRLEKNEDRKLKIIDLSKDMPIFNEAIGGADGTGTVTGIKEEEDLDLVIVESDPEYDDLDLAELDEIIEEVIPASEEQPFVVDMGVVTITKLKQEHEIIYFEDDALDNLVEQLVQLGFDPVLADQWAQRSMQLTKQTLIRLDSKPIDQSNPILAQYLALEPLYSKPWLIPVIRDQKRVYDARMAETQADTYFISESLDDQIKYENDLLALSHEYTDREINTKLVSARFGYRPLSELVQRRFRTPDPDRQDYTIQALRSARFELRSAYGPVDKKHNLYAKTPSINRPIIGQEYLSSVLGELIEVLGFVRIPNTIVSKPNKLVKYWHQIRTSDISLEDLSSEDLYLFASPNETKKYTIAQINKRQLFPSYTNLLQYYQTMLTTEAYRSLAQFAHCCLDPYDLKIQYLPTRSYLSIINSITNKIQQLVSKANFAQRTERLAQLLNASRDQASSLTKIGLAIEDELLTDKIITEHYGTYPYWGSSADSNMNRFLWIKNQYDKGQLVYELLKKLDLVVFYSKAESLINSIGDQRKKITSLQTSINSILDQLDSSMIELNKSYRVSVFDEKTGQHKTILAHPPLVRLYQDQRLVFWFTDDNFQGYVSREVYAQILQLKVLQERQKIRTYYQSLLDNRALMTQIVEQELTRSINYYQKLKENALHKNQRLKIETNIQLDQLGTLSDSILDLFLDIKLGTPQTNQQFLHLLHTYGVLDQDKRWYVLKQTRQKVCCVHRHDFLKGLPVDQYRDVRKEGQFCQICHESLTELEFDIFEGYDEHNNPIVTREGDIYDSYLEDIGHQVEKLFQLGSIDDQAVLDCSQIPRDPQGFRYFACQILTYIQRDGQMRLTVEQIKDAIEIYYSSTSLQDLQLLDINNPIIREQYWNDYLVQREKLLQQGQSFNLGKKVITQQLYQTWKNSNNPKDQQRFQLIRKKWKAGFSNELQLVDKFNRYLMVIVAGIIAHELALPETMDKDRLTQQILIQTQTIGDNLTKIKLQLSEDSPPESILKIPSRGLDMNRKIIIVNSSLQEYLKVRMGHFYQVITSQSWIQLRYREAKNIQTQIPVTVPEAETIELPPLERPSNLEQASLAQLRTFTKSISQYLRIKQNQLIQYALQLVSNSAELMAILQLVPINYDCPVDPRYFYISYLINAGHSDFRQFGLGLREQALRAVVKTEVKLSPEEKALVMPLMDDFQLTNLKQEHAQLVQETLAVTAILDQKLTTTQREQLSLQLLKPIQSTQLAFGSEVQTPLHTGQATTTTTVSLTELKTMITSLANSINTNVIQSLINSLVSKIKNYVILNEQQTANMVNFLTNLGRKRYRFEEIGEQIQQLTGRYGHHHDTKVVEHLFRTDQLTQIIVEQNQAILSYFYLTRYLVSIFQQHFGFDVVSEPEINDDLVQLIESIRTLVNVTTIKELFNSYQYISIPDENLEVSNDLLEQIQWITDDHNQSKQILMYLFYTELLNNLENVELNEGNLFAQFVYRLIEYMAKMHTIKDVTYGEIEFMFEKHKNKRSRDHARTTKAMNADERYLRSEQLRTGLLSYSEIYLESLEVPTETAEPILEGDDIALSQGNFQGENEYENEDSLNDDFTYD